MDREAGTSATGHRAAAEVLVEVVFYILLN